MIKKIRLGEGSDYILVADSKQIYKFKDSGEAEARLRMLKSKFPQRNFELKHEVCSLQDVAEGDEYDSDSFEKWKKKKEYEKEYDKKKPRDDSKSKDEKSNTDKQQDVAKSLNEFAPDRDDGGEEENPHGPMSFTEFKTKLAVKLGGNTKGITVNYSGYSGGMVKVSVNDRHRIEPLNILGVIDAVKFIKSLNGQQGVAEGSGGNWYIRVNGKILNDTKFKPVIFSSEDEARSHAMKLADKKRIPLSQMKLTKSWMDEQDQGVAEGKYCIKHRTTGKVLSTHDDKSSAQDELAGIASNKDYKVAKATAPKKEFSMKENKKQNVAEGSVDQLPTQGADYSKHSTDELELMLRPGVMHRDEARFKTRIRRELRKREAQQAQQGVAEGFDKLSPQHKAHEYNLDAAQKEMDSRHAQGEDMTGATIDKKTYKIVKPKKQGVAESSLNEGAIETITALVKKIPGIGKYYQMAQQYKPQLIEILKTSKSGKEVKQKMEQLAAGQSATVAESGMMKQLGGLALGGGSILSTMWMNAMGMIDGVFAHAAAGEVGGAVASGSILGLIPVTLMLFAAMLLFKGSAQSSEEKAQRGQQGVAEGADPTDDSSQEARGDHRGEVKKNKDGSYVATNQAGSRKIFKSQNADEAHANSGQQDVAEDSEVASWIDAKGSTVPAKNRKDKAEKGAPVSGPSVSDRFRTSPHGDVVTAMNRKLHIPKVKESVALPDAKLMRNIAEGLVRMDDLVLNRPVYGNPSVTDRRVVQRMVREFAEAGIDYRDAVVELVEYFRQETIKEDGLPSIPPLPTAAPAAAAPAVAPAAATTTTAAVTPDEAAKQEAAALAKIQANAGLKGQLDQLVTKSGTPAAAPAAPGQPAAAAPDYTAALAKIKANAGLAPQLTALLAKAQ